MPRICETITSQAIQRRPRRLIPIYVKGPSHTDRSWIDLYGRKKGHAGSSGNKISIDNNPQEDVQESLENGDEVNVGRKKIEEESGQTQSH